MEHGAKASSLNLPHPDDLRAYLSFLRDMGVHDLLTQARSEATERDAIEHWAEQHLRPAAAGARTPSSNQVVTTARVERDPVFGAQFAPAGSQTPPPQTRVVPQRSGAPPPQMSQANDLSPFDRAQQRRAGTLERTQPPRAGAVPEIRITPLVGLATGTANNEMVSPLQAMPAPLPFNQLAPLPLSRIGPHDKAAALQQLRETIGDCTRCPLAYAGRHSIVFADGNPNAKLMFVGEGPGADEDEQGLPFVGKAGQLLNNMVAAMGLARDQVYIANIVKCRPPKNRVPEPLEANTCAPFLLQQIDIVQPSVIVALGGTAATYLLGVKQSLTSLRGQWFDVRGAKCAVTYHPAFLLRDPRQKGEAWKDLQRVMAELKLQPPTRA